MTTLREAQELLQQAILADDAEPVLELIGDGAREDRRRLLAVYQHAYRARLRDVLLADYPKLARLLGTETFADLASAYTSVCPSHHPNARWFGERLPRFLADTVPWKAEPHLAGMATFEHALNTVFDARDESAIGVDRLASIEPDDWPGLTFQPIGAVRRLCLDRQVIDLWSATEDAMPVVTTEQNDPVELLVFRQQHRSRFRFLSEEEALMWDEMVRGTPFGTLCELVATFGGETEAAPRAAGYLGGWLSAGLVASAGTLSR